MRIKNRLSAASAWATILLLACLGAVPEAVADDRDLLRQGSGDPYVFIIFDTSRSMNRTPKCTLDDFNRPVGDPLKCDFLCPNGDCYAPLNGDDPASKLYQAKEALYEVLQGIDDVYVGFSSFNQDELEVRAKHWLYEVATKDDGGNANSGIVLDNNQVFPAIGSEEVFGRTWNCASGMGFAGAGCTADNPADLGDPNELRRVQRLSKLGIGNNEMTTFFIRDTAGTTYKVIYTQNSSFDYGDAKFRARIEVRKCTDAACTTTALTGQKEIFYDLVGEFLSWDLEPNTMVKEQGFFDELEAADASAINTCDGWDPNDDSALDDNASSYNLRWPTDLSDPRDDPGDSLSIGDVLPLDWDDDHLDETLERLAPSIDPVSGLADFRVSSYLEDVPRAGENFLRLVDPSERPLIAVGQTPIGAALKSFRTWYLGCPQGACKKDEGWRDLADGRDLDFACRQTYLLIITDGDEDCPGPDACSGTAALRAQTGIKTFAVGFGVENTSGNRLNCLAANGGTGDPIYPQNKGELIEALNSIFGEIRVQKRAFASAAVPTVQSETSDKIYLSSFTPLPDLSVWPGRLDAFRKPLPLTDDDKPDVDRDCKDNDLQASCHLWEAGEKLFAQAPDAAQVAGGQLKLGMGIDQRRVLYGMDNLTSQVPGTLRLFSPPPLLATSARRDLFRGLGLIFTPGDLLSEAAAAAQADTIIGETLRQKVETVVDADGNTTTFPYVLGDVFHADPQLTGTPNDLRFFRDNLFGYRDFAKSNFWRRRMLIVASNDGQLHFFDAGIRALVNAPGFPDPIERFTDGTGTELFSFMPRLAMPVIRELALEDRHVYSLDGSPTVADAYYDPIHNGTPSPNDRGWRTVLVGGMREGGDVLGADFVTDFISGYYALDITQPDRLSNPSPTPADPDPRPYPLPVGSVVPSCLSVDTATGNHLSISECKTPAGSPFPFPAQLWSFTDRVVISGVPYELDEDNIDSDPAIEGNGEPDLGDTWSKPVIGQIELCVGATCDPNVTPNNIETRFVAIFGGGFDHELKLVPKRGNWLYMVDIETGKAIYKRQLIGAAPAGPAALDRDQDGILDTIYIGTTAGYLYKVDLTALTSTGKVPALTSVPIGNDRLAGSPLGAGVIGATVSRVTDEAWEPFQIFNTFGRPIFMTPTLFLVPDLDQFAVSFGVGDRESLWRPTGVAGRFYTLVDEDFAEGDIGLPQDEGDYDGIPFDSTNRPDSLLLDQPPGSRGWYLELETDDRVITQAFAVVGVVVFTTFRPVELDVGVDEDLVCARTGRSRVFVVDAENANALTDLDTETTVSIERYLDVLDFTTAPYVDQTATKNPPSDDDGRNTESIIDPRQEALQESIRQSLMRFFPEGCRYNRAYSLTINASRSDTGFYRYATIPIAMCPLDWRERQ